MEGIKSKTTANGKDVDGGSAARVRAWAPRTNSHKQPAKQILQREDEDQTLSLTKSRFKIDLDSEENLETFSEDERKPTGNSHYKREVAEESVKDTKDIASLFPTSEEDDGGRIVCRLPKDRRHGRDGGEKRERVKDKYSADYHSVKDKATERKSIRDRDGGSYGSDKRKRISEGDIKLEKEYRTETTSQDRRQDGNEKPKKGYKSGLTHRDADEKPKRDYRTEYSQKNADEKLKREHKSQKVRKDARREEHGGKFDRWELKSDQDGPVKDQHNEFSPDSQFKSSSKNNRPRSSVKASHGKEKDQRDRSRSASPKPKPRHSSDSKREHEKSPHSRHGDRNARGKTEKDWERGWEKPEKDKVNSSVAFDNQYRRFGGRGSGIGGYSPRKRRSDAAMKTPSPPPKSPDRDRKKPRAWDLAPSGVDSNMVAAMAVAQHATAHQAMVQQAAALASVAGVPSAAISTGFMMPTLSSSVFQQGSPAVTAVSLTQATRHLRRLYVGNIPSTVSEGELLEFINAAMLSANSNHLPGTRPCISCSVHVDKSYAYAEFLTPEDATTALALDGVTLHGATLKIKRPKDFMHQINDSLEFPSLAIDIVSNVVVDSPHKIFVGGISPSISSDKVKEIVTAFGQLKAYHWELDRSRSPPAACAFLEYMDPLVTLKACAGLNGMKLGSGILTVVQATPDALSEGLGGAVPFYGVPEHAKPLLETATCILEFQNVVTEEELSSSVELDLDEVMEDVRIECLRFGNVRSVCCMKSATEVCLISFIGVQKKKLFFLEECMTQSRQHLQDTDCMTKAFEKCLGVSTCLELPNSSNTSQLVDQHVDSNKCFDLEIVSSMPQSFVEGNLNSEGTDKLNLSGDLESIVSISEMPIVESQENVENKAAGIFVESEAKDEETTLPNHLLKYSFESLVSSEKYRASAETISMEETHANESIGLDSRSLHVGRVYVEFSRKESACQAAHSLHGRAYGGKNVSVSYFPEEIYHGKICKRVP